mmetsp:Transcript_4844/g.14709  ORF Transcript_4844/g.14709 Transcript_4844/m.14709 type:complete len:260 (-) Transcript_4844:2787-3566(-)
MSRGRGPRGVCARPAIVASGWSAAVPPVAVVGCTRVADAAPLHARGSPAGDRTSSSVSTDERCMGSDLVWNGMAGPLRTRDADTARWLAMRRGSAWPPAFWAEGLGLAAAGLPGRSGHAEPRPACAPTKLRPRGRGQCQPSWLRCCCTASTTSARCRCSMSSRESASSASPPALRQRSRSTSSSRRGSPWSRAWARGEAGPSSCMSKCTLDTLARVERSAGAGAPPTQLPSRGRFTALRDSAERRGPKTPAAPSPKPCW